ncbi:iron chelate uptake ABC transporter family permease subunit [Persicobacter psychrovividus]|uniref:Manganese transport system membrane protein MntC n=1 Tax=Persicobacter psychrovividus TaxID=387638 RepID=A0ABM7VD64_9BACT|nr:manganese transport system membrane protein MntC [Persicobacter psychrovividus]
MEALLEFLSFQDPSVRMVTLGAIILTASSALVGCFTFLKKQALIGDAVAHAVLPGVCLAFLLTGVKNPIYLIIGAFTTGWLSLQLINFISQHSKIKEDTAISLVLSVFFGFGILLMTFIQHGDYADQSGLDHFLFGQAASLVGSDLIIFLTVGLAIMALILLFFKELTLIAFDRDFASATGLPVKWLELLLTSLTVLAVVIGIQAVGVVLMAAMLITPPAAARYWTDHLPKMVWFATLFGAFSGFSGAMISYVAPSMPTGPWIVVIATTIALISILFAPNRGIIFKLRRQYENQHKILTENILKSFFYLGKNKEDIKKHYSAEALLEIRPNLGLRKLKKGLRSLQKDGYLINEKKGFRLSNEGVARAKRVVKLHRLWEVYLTTYLNLDPDHVHDSAETMEHVITPELEKRLEEKLDFPDRDPHDEEIPYH